MRQCADCGHAEGCHVTTHGKPVRCNELVDIGLGDLFTCGCLKFVPKSGAKP